MKCNCTDTELEFPNNIHLEAAKGWRELGDPQSALEELAKIDKRFEYHIEVLTCYWYTHVDHQHWTQAEVVGQTISKQHPNSKLGWLYWSQSLYWQKKYQEAYNVLEKVHGSFLSDDKFPYNLACYACRLGRPKRALAWICDAIRISSKHKVKEQALGDRDLEPIWDEIQNL